MGLFLASKLTRLALGAAQTALAAGEACRTGKKIEKRVREALRPQKEDVITMKKIDFCSHFGVLRCHCRRADCRLYVSAPPRGRAG